MDDCARINQKVQRVAIVGTGLLGASLGLGLRSVGFTGTIIGIGRRLTTVRRAEEIGSVDEGTTDLEAAGSCGLVVLATPLGSFARLLGTLARHDGVITDVGSTKQQVCEDAQRLLADPSRFVGSHPMAGSERHGPDAARADLFSGRPCVLTPRSETSAEALETVRALWGALGMVISTMAPEEHDRKIAAISHLPHVLAMELVHLGVDRAAIDVASTGFSGTTRVASGDPVVWSDIFRTNRGEVVRAVELMIERLQRFNTAMRNESDDEVLAQLQTAKSIRDEWLNRARNSNGT